MVIISGVPIFRIFTVFTVCCEALYTFTSLCESNPLFVRQQAHIYSARCVCVCVCVWGREAEGRDEGTTRRFVLLTSQRIQSSEASAKEMSKEDIGF